jgi:hypothetical protein
MGRVWDYDDWVTTGGSGKDWVRGLGSGYTLPFMICMVCR